MATRTIESATLAGGCFWCLEAVFQQLRGVAGVKSGYAGGEAGNPTYEEVCRGRTGHAEVVRIDYDPAVITFRDLLDVFFTIHDPTTLNRQGNDIGTQYRSAIFFHSPRQEEEALEAIAAMEAAGIWEASIVTEVAPLTRFFPAEGYHDDYFRRNPGQGYCQFIIAPKVAKFRKKFLARLKE